VSTVPSTALALLRFIEEHNTMARLFNCQEIDPNALTRNDRIQLKEKLECELSPENLTCDGELSNAEVRVKSIYLNRVSDELAKVAA